MGVDEVKESVDRPSYQESLDCCFDKKLVNIYILENVGLNESNLQSLSLPVCYSVQ